jgi:hypothetical protein
MSNFLMIVMFFVTPPALGDNRPWALQSTQSSEFTSWEACDDAMKMHLIPVAQTTDTISVVGFCLPKDFKGPERKQALIDLKTKDNQLIGKKGAEFSQLFADKTEHIAKAKAEVGSCYTYIPSPVPVGPSEKKLSGTMNTGILGTCIKP